MNRLLSTLMTDVRLQKRNGFYWAAAFVAVISVVVLRRIPGLNLTLLLPAFVINNLLVGTFYFFSGLMLLERQEGTLEAQTVTPLRAGEYLWAKVITLTVLSVCENLFIVAFTFGFSFNIVLMTAGIAAGSALFCLFGFVAVVRYRSINEYILPSSLITTLLLLPLISYFDLWQHPLFTIHPIQAPLTLLRAALAGSAPRETIIAFALVMIWLVLIFFWSRRAFHRHVNAKVGGP